MASRKILTVEEQKHLLSTLPELFQSLTQAEIQDIIVKLGLQDLLDQNGNLITVYTVDIYSNKPTYIISDYSIKIRGNAYSKGLVVNDEVTSWRWERISGVPAEDTAWAQGKNTQELTLSESDFTSRLNTRDITFKVYATIKNIEYSDEITYSKSQIFNKIQIKTSHDLFFENSPSSIALTTVEEGTFSDYKWYLGDNLVASTRNFNLSVNSIPLRSSAVLKVEAKDPTGKIHSDTKTIPRISNGSNGEPGVPGEPGSNSYTWIKYSNSPDGTNMSDYPVNSITGLSRNYIGIASNKSTPTESNNPLDYTWAKYVGTDGIPGENGYMWIKYSEYPLGRDTNGTVSMFDTPFIMENGVREDMVYMGIAYNKQTKTEADPNTPEGAPEVYTWAKIKGENGHSNYILQLSNDNTSVPALADGTIPNPGVAFSTATTNILLTYGNDTVDRGEYTLQFNASSGVTFVTSNEGHTLSITGLTTDVGQIEVKAFSTETTPKIIATATFSIVKIKGSAIYEIFPSVNAIKVTNTPGQNPTLSPTAIEVNVKMNTGESVSYVTSGKLTYKYIYANTNSSSTDDGTQITIGELMQIDNSGNPLFIEFKYFHPVTNALVDIERVSFNRDGVSGTSVEHRYKSSTNPTTPPALDISEVNPTGWSIDMPVLTTGEVLWMTKATKKGDTGTLIGTWSNPVRISGATGPQGPQGINGTSGPTPRLLEFVQGASYENGGLYIDYAYYRSNDINEGWYTVKLPTGHTPGTVVNQIYAGGIPDNTKFDKAPFTKEMSFGTVIAEQANLAGFIFRNQVLYSQTGAKTSSCHPTPDIQLSNLALDGFNGIIKFLDRMIINKEGIILKDDCGVKRMAFQWLGGTPILKFYAEDGVTVTWQAGQNGYQTITIIARDNAWYELHAIVKSNIPLSSEPTGVDSRDYKRYFCDCGDTQLGQYTGYAGPVEYKESIIGYRFTRGTDITTSGGANSVPLTMDGRIVLYPNSVDSPIADGWYITSLDSDSSPTRCVAVYEKVVNGFVVKTKEVYQEYEVALVPCGTLNFDPCY